ncbi:MAG: transcription elongation factor GreB [Thiotrichales bacterium]
MGRYRPPQPKSSPYITAEGFHKLQIEHDALWTRRREVVRALAAAAAEGDRSENAEYIYRKKELREIDRRVRYLQKRLPDLKVINTRPDDPRRIFFGAEVELEDEHGAEMRCRIVGADEIEPAHNWISMDSPMARAMLGKALDDEITVLTPTGAVAYLIVAIAYRPPVPAA